MLDNYFKLMNMRLEEMKEYLHHIEDNYDENIDFCFMVSQLNDYVNNHREHYLHLALKSIINEKGVDAIEKNLIMLLYFFNGEKEVEQVKIILKKMAMQYHKGIHVYQILRHIMNMDNVSLIHILFNKGYLNVNEAAFINIVEEKYEEAFEYLKESELDNEALLDYFCASAPRLYHQLMRRNKANALYRLSFA